MNKSVQLSFEAVDSLIFRDGRPFNQSDDGASRAVSVFPPYPPTLVGAVRAALWQVPLADNWDKAKLGNGTDWHKDTTLGPLSFGPPVLLKGDEPLFPVPLHLVEGEEQGRKKLGFLAPGPERDCDLGRVRLPVVPYALKGIKPIEDRWVTLAGMTEILAGKPPAADQLVKTSRLWAVEPRVGVGLDSETRATIKSQLYMASHVRLADDVKLGIEMSGWNDALPEMLRPLAGEHRMAQIAPVQTRWNLPVSTKTQNGRYCIVLLSPLVLDTQPKPGQPLENLPGTLVSACLGKPVSIGGWDSKTKPPGPIPLRHSIPAGSVFFMQLGETEQPDWAKLVGGIGIGNKWGFGQYLIGAWQGSKR